MKQNYEVFELISLASLFLFLSEQVEWMWTGELVNWLFYYFPGFTANLASFFILRECGKYNIIFHIFNNVYPWLIRVAQDCQGWSNICCLLVHLFTSVFWRHGIFFENRLPMAPRPPSGWWWEAAPFLPLGWWWEAAHPLMSLLARGFNLLKFTT